MNMVSHQIWRLWLYFLFLMILNKTLKSEAIFILFSLSSLLTVFPDSADAQTYSNKGMAQRIESCGTEKYPCRGVDHKTPFSEIRAAKWIKKDTFISDLDRPLS